jgi:hypothetical protein
MRDVQSTTAHDVGRLPIALMVVFAACVIGSAAAQTQRSPGPATGGRTVLTRSQLFGTSAPSAPLDDTAAFAMPPNAAQPTEVFEGTLALRDLATSGSFTGLSDVFSIIPGGDSAWKHLPPFSYQFVQSGTHLIPAVQGLIHTGSPAWNYIIGPGRVWQEAADDGYMRASLPFAIVQRNQNCVHNGAMTFLFSNTKSPRVSTVYYQVTQETCYPMKFDLWGVAPGAYTPASVPGAATLREKHNGELAARMPRRPLEALRRDAPSVTFDPTVHLHGFKDPKQVTTYGVVFNGVNYTSGCPTRSGEYAFCDEMRLPSYSIAKSAFAGVALMRLAQLYGPRVYSLLIKDFVPEHSTGGKWDATTFTHTLSMATGNFDSDAYEADENGRTMDRFIVEESYAGKMSAAFALQRNRAEPGSKWVYQSSATFVVTQAMNAFLRQQRGNDADIFDLVRDDVYVPLRVSSGGLTTIRTANSPTGAPAGYYGLFFSSDDIAKIGGFLNAGTGVIGGTPVLDATRLKEALFRTPTAASVGVPIVGTSRTSALGALQLGSNQPRSSNTRRYAHGFWGRFMTATEFPQHSCDFWVSLMVGYGGNTVLLLPNGVVSYVFSDGMEFPWVGPAHELSKLSPYCK